MKIKAPWKNDVNVLIIFFARDSVLEKTFESVRLARPRRLLLWQDGPRKDRPDDIEAIARCRRIVEQIDWDCEVYKNYQEINLGCDPSTFYSHKWAFSIVDKCIILEDDCVPSQSFYPFCKELLMRYENDTRINRICGMCNIANYNSPYDYLFSKAGSGPGFATWRRVSELWDEEYSFLDDEYDMGKVLKLYSSKDNLSYHKLCQSHKATMIPHWETIWSYANLLNSQLVIIPTKNLVHNIGLGADSTHSNTEIEKIMPSIRQITYQPSYEIQFPIKHPRYILEDKEYFEMRTNILGRGSWLNHIVFRIKCSLWRLSHINISSLTNKVFRKF